MYPNETKMSLDTKINTGFIIIFILLLNFFVVNTVAAIPEDSIKVIAKTPEAGAPSIYQINFQISKLITNKAEIKIEFPNTFDLSGLLVAGSGTIKGGFEMSVAGQIVSLKRTGLGNEIAINKKVDVKFAIVTNPKNPSDDYPIKIEIFDDNNRSIFKKQESVKIIPKTE